MLQISGSFISGTHLSPVFTSFSSAASGPFFKMSRCRLKLNVCAVKGAHLLPTPDRLSVHSPQFLFSLSLSAIAEAGKPAVISSPLSPASYIYVLDTFCILSRPPAPSFSTILSPVVQVYNSMYSASVHESPVSCQAL